MTLIPFDRQMDMFIENAPDGYFAPMLQLDTRPWYLEANPGAANSFTHLSQIAGDGKFRRNAGEYVKAMIRHCEEVYGDRIWGYFLLGGTTTEWFSDFDYETTHPTKEEAYKVWKNDREASLPSAKRLNRVDGTFLGADESDVVEARRFHAELIADLVLHFAKEAQSVLDHKKLLGLYFGYLFELGSPRLHNAGHLDYEKVFLSPHIDMISSPSSYGFRSQTDPSAFMVTQKTLYAHNKLYFLEFDHRTHTSPDRITEPIWDSSGNKLYDSANFPGSDSKCKNDTEALNLMYRDFALCQAAGASLWWFDMLDGWFRSEKMMAAVKHMLAINRRLSPLDKGSVAEIAVFTEGESMYHVRKQSNIASACLSGIRRTLAETGAPYDIYSICDIALPKIEHYRFLIFVNQYDIPDAVKSEIDRLRRPGKTILWLFAPNFAHKGEYSVENISKTVGMSVEMSEGSHGRAQYKGIGINPPGLGPYFSINDARAQPVALYEDSKTAIAHVDIDGCRVVYSGLYTLPSALLRDLARSGGVFVYSDDPRVYVYPNSAFLGVYNGADRDAVIRVKDAGTYRDLIGECNYTSENNILTLPKGEQRNFLLCPVK